MDSLDWQNGDQSSSSWRSSGAGTSWNTAAPFREMCFHNFKFNFACIWSHSDSAQLIIIWIPTPRYVCELCYHWSLIRSYWGPGFGYPRCWLLKKDAPCCCKEYSILVPCIPYHLTGSVILEVWCTYKLVRCNQELVPPYENGRSECKVVEEQQRSAWEG